MAQRLTPDRIVTEALAIARSDGVGGLTLRPLAARLNVSAPALYRHVASRRALLGLMVERLLEQTPTLPPDLRWDEALRMTARRLREAYEPYPGLAVELLAGRVGTDRTRLEADRLVAALRAGGMARADAERIVDALLDWLLAYLAVAGRDGRQAFEEGVELFVAGLRSRLSADEVN